jgi:hypothetical protein
MKYHGEEHPRSQQLLFQMRRTDGGLQKAGTEKAGNKGPRERGNEEAGSEGAKERTNDEI